MPLFKAIVRYINVIQMKPEAYVEVQPLIEKYEGAIFTRQLFILMDRYFFSSTNKHT